MKLLLPLFLYSFSCAAQPANSGAPCSDPAIHDQRSAELQRLLAEDQADRAWSLPGSHGALPAPSDLEAMNQHDLDHRKRVGEIFGEGCLRSKEDYAAAFLLFQHGNTSEQYFQAFLWAKTALELGDKNAECELPMAADRYLVSTGHKQLFGTQASMSGDCWCIQPIEPSFPNELREKYRGGANAAFTGLPYLKTLNAGKSCRDSYCEPALKPSPRGSIPGFW
jgi:hypothetical protein